MSSINLSSLPAPQFVEILDYETILASRKARLLSLIPADQVAAVEATLAIESEPLTILLQESAYESLVLRARINDSSKANLLAFAVDGDLDHRAAFYGVSRLADELDDRLRKRVQLQIAALAGNGTKEGYLAKAMAASLDVVDAAVLNPSAGAVDVALWIASGADVDATLDVVRHALQADDARILGVPLTVRQAVPKTVDIAAKIYRESSAPVDISQQLESALSQAFTSYAQLGRDISQSWLLSKLHVSGVSRVELVSPAHNVTLGPAEYAVMGSVSLIDGGVAW